MYRPEEVLYTCDRELLWECSVCGNEYWETVEYMISMECSCPYCEGRILKKGVNSLFDKYPELMTAWSAKNRENPDRIIYTTKASYIWKCNDCGGEYLASVVEIINGACNCPYCAGKRLLSGYNSLDVMYPDLVKFWSTDNEKSPDSVLHSSMTQYLWKCDACGGIDSTTIFDRLSDDYKCPYCENKKFLKGLNSLKEENSCLLGEWDYRNNYLLGLPEDVFCKSGAEYWWICKECGYHYKMSPRKRSYYLFRHQKSCPHCKGHRRNKIYFF